jgi:hypothetical protein
MTSFKLLLNLYLKSHCHILLENKKGLVLVWFGLVWFGVLLYQGLNSGPVLARQAPYYLSHAFSPFASVIFSNKVFFLCLGQPGLRSSHFCFPLSWDDRHVPLYPGKCHLWRWGLKNLILPGLASNCDPPDLHLSSSEDCRFEPPCLGQKCILNLKSEFQLKL